MPGCANDTAPAALEPPNRGKLLHARCTLPNPRRQNRDGKPASKGFRCHCPKRFKDPFSPMDSAETAPLSFGLDVLKPWNLRTVTTGEVLCGIRDGTWREPVNHVRSLQGTERSEAKKLLPYWTPSGTFSSRRESGLIAHSGQVAIDLDHVPAAKRRETIHVAVDDPHCAAAFLSASAEGVRLIFKTPPCTARQHSAVFDHVADHVRRLYRIEPDLTGRDVSRPSFVSFDEGLWFRPSAEILPVRLLPEPEEPDTVRSYCVRSLAEFEKAQEKHRESKREERPLPLASKPPAKPRCQPIMPRMLCEWLVRGRVDSYLWPATEGEMTNAQALYAAPPPPLLVLSLTVFSEAIMHGGHQFGSGCVLSLQCLIDQPIQLTVLFGATFRGCFKELQLRPEYFFKQFVP